MKFTKENNMVVRQITNQNIVSLEDLDRQIVSRQSGVTTLPIENIPSGLQQGDTIEIEQKPTYVSNIEKNAG
jgi:hypothetical protein